MILTENGVDKVNELDVSSFTWRSINVYDSIVRWGVPIFVMISGALFLGKERPIKVLFSKHIGRILITFLAWSVFYTAWNNFNSGESHLFRELIMSDLKGHYHMWFLYMIACLYMVVPFLNLIVRHRKLTNYFIILAFLFVFAIPQCITIIGIKSEYLSENIQNVLSETHMYFVLGFTGYFVLGYVLHKTQIGKKCETIIYIMGIGSLFFTVFVTMWISKRNQESSELFYNSMTVNILTTSIAIFVFAKQHMNKPLKSEKAMHVLSYISKCTFGVYLVHLLIINCLRRFVGITNLSFNPIISVPILALIVFVCSMGISAIMNKIPFVKKWFV